MTCTVVARARSLLRSQDMRALPICSPLLSTFRLHLSFFFEITNIDSKYKKTQ